MLGLAMMAYNLARMRVTPRAYKMIGYQKHGGPVSRAGGAGGFASYEYYQIIDRISRGEKP